MNSGVGMLESGVFQRRVAGILNVSQGAWGVTFRMWNRHLTHRDPSHRHGGGRDRTTTRHQDRFCWFSLDVNGFITLRPWITSSGTELECAFLHKQWETDSISSGWMPEDPLYAFRWRDTRAGLVRLCQHSRQMDYSWLDASAIHWWVQILSRFYW